MARVNRSRKDQLENTLLHVQCRFDGTPLSCVGDLLVHVISEVQRSHEAGGSSADNAARISTYAIKVLELLPKSFGKRFAFDAQLIRVLADEYSQGGAKLSGMLVPKPSQSWGHQTVSMPSTDGTTTYAVDLIHLPGEDNVEDITLLDYPFICHELGHHILFKDGDGFIALFSKELESVLSGLQRRTLGIRGFARQIAEATTNQIRQYWAPTPDQFNWAHEIAVDVIAIWLSGPAYLAAIQDVMEDDNLNPFQLGKSHPTYETRGRALIEASECLGWAYYTGPFRTLLSRWEATPPSGDRTNLHVACADPQLINAAVSAAIKTCQALSLPSCTAARVAAVENALREGLEIELGTDLLIAAWLQYCQSSEADYHAWEIAAIARILAEITE
ncbi:MAG: hypothetical protein J0M26_19035 [Planctomycetes bacterium]|nr:hypothetical protein [Planctomycetota bacterium]